MASEFASESSPTLKPMPCPRLASCLRSRYAAWGGKHCIGAEDGHVEDRWAKLDGQVPLQGMLGYLNFAGGKGDPRFQKSVSDAFEFLANSGSTTPWIDLEVALTAKLDSLASAKNAAFLDARQARAVLRLAFHQLLRAYREHHRDLLFHAADAELFQPFFVACVCQAVAGQGPP